MWEEAGCQMERERPAVQVPQIRFTAAGIRQEAVPWHGCVCLRERRPILIGHSSLSPLCSFLWFYVDFAANFYTSNTANAGRFLQCGTRNIAVAGLNLSKLDNLYLSIR